MYICMYNELFCDKNYFFFYIFVYICVEFSIDCYIYICILLISYLFMYDWVIGSDVISSICLYEEINYNGE